MPKRQKIAHNLITCLSLLLVGTFAFWWFNPSHIPNNFYGEWRVFDVLLFLIVTYVIWHPIMMEVLSWAIISQIKERPRYTPAEGLKVAFITNFVPGSESIDLLYTTLPAMLAVDYPHDVWLLDEGNDPEVKAYCKSIGVHHYSRAGLAYYNTDDGKYAKKTKGGNHNSWYDGFGNDYDIVAQIDTDFIPSKDFLTKTLGYFNDPEIAFVGTPQVYGNTKESFIARGAAEQTYNFYGPILRGLYGMDTTLLIGANHIMRVKALQSVDHYSAHITEDLLTGMKLHAKGWKSVYVAEALAIGEGPTTWQSYFNQQMRWAYGCIDVLFRHSPRLLPKMRFRSAVYYLFIQQHYFSGLAMMMSVLAISIYFIFGYNSIQMDIRQFLALYIPVLVLMMLTFFWTQRFYVRPKEERGFHLAGKVISVAAWPVFFLALIGVIRKKRLTYKVTPKGHGDIENPNRITFRVFRFHLLVGLMCVAGIGLALLRGHNSIVMIGLAAATAALMFVMPFVLIISIILRQMIRFYRYITWRLRQHYKFYEFRAQDRGLLPTRVSEKEKYQYIKRRHKYLIACSIVSFTTAFVSQIFFLFNHTVFWPLYIFLGLTLVYFVISLTVNLFTHDFDMNRHKLLLARWNPSIYPSVDVFLPTAGESVEILRNTWQGVRELIHGYPGRVLPYVLDDSDRPEVAELAREFSFIYEVRPNRGEFKKAGNLRHGYKISNGDFIVIFDADFRPRHDFLKELLPYFYANPKMGIVQSPQYFDVHSDQNWLERGAGSVQELFYRYAQVSRQRHDASICVGSNAIYRRAALDEIGGTALIEHSEDVHTGFNLRIKGWTIQYVPIVLAKGLCPASMNAFFKQQYRWCRGSMSLLGSRKFWNMKLSFRTRLSYSSGFLYYIHTAVGTFLIPITPIAVLWLYPTHVNLVNYFLVLPSLIFTQLVFPFWHNSIYGIEAWSVRSIYGWAHMFAVFDAVTGKSMSWKPTGSKMKVEPRYLIFRGMQVVFNFIPAMIWVGLALWKLVELESLSYVPLLASGLYYFFVTAKITFYMEKTAEQKVAPAPKRVIAPAEG